MKYVLTFLTFFTTATFCFSQGTAQLDAKYGFKHFIFYTSPSKYSSEIIKIKSWDPNPKISEYEYVGGKLNDLFGVVIDKVSLTYYENKLASIRIDFGNSEQEFIQGDFERILYSLKNLYGNGNGLSFDDEDFIMYGGRKWIGKKVSLEILRLKYKDNNILGYISLSEISLFNKRIKDEF